MNTNINTAMQPIFDKLQVNPVDFKYFEKLNKFISAESINLYGDSANYVIVININNNIGTVLLGTTDGVTFHETSLLGQIVLKNNEWKIL